MTGLNLDLLPRDLVALNPFTGLDATLPARVWHLVDVNSEGTIAYFELAEFAYYSSSVSFSLLATPFNPPRTEFKDFIDATV